MKPSRSSGTRVHINSLAELVDPVIQHIKDVRASHPALKVFIYGHSMGGLVAINAILQEPQMFSGFVAVGPLVRAHPSLDTKQNRLFVTKVLTLFGPLTQLHEVFPLAPSDLAPTTRDPNVTAQRNLDDLIWQGGFRAGMMSVLIKASDHLAENLGDRRTPLLVLQGGKDRHVDPSGSKMLVDKSTTSDKEYVLYPEAFHNLVVELEDVKWDVLDRIMAFMERITGTSRRRFPVK